MKTTRLTKLALSATALALLAASPARTQDGGEVSSQGTELTLKEIREAEIAFPEILSEEDWSFGAVSGKVIRTAHYRIFTTESTPILRERISRFSEYALPHYRTSLTPNKPLPRPSQRLDTYLMDNRPQWTEVTKRLTGRKSDDLLKISRGGFAFQGIGVYYDLGVYDTLAIAAHEGWHQYTQRTFKSGLPIWLEEGIATYNEGHKWDRATPRFRPWSNLERYEKLASAHKDGRLMSLEELLEGSPQEFFDGRDDSLLVFYAQLWALVHFLNEYDYGKYQASLRILLQDSASGRVRDVLTNRLGEGGARSTLLTRSGPAVFLAYFGEDLDAINAEYQSFIATITGPNTREKIAVGRSPLEP